MKVSRIMMLLVAFAAASAAVAADMLPLKPGIYVPADIACKGAPNSQIVNYRGGKSAIGAAQASCTINKLTIKGKVYTINDQCRDVQSGGSFADDPVVLTIASPESFTMNGARYRYCGTKVQF